jgi:hypothetical protein
VQYMRLHRDPLRPKRIAPASQHRFPAQTLPLSDPLLQRVQQHGADDDGTVGEVLPEDLGW